MKLKQRPGKIKSSNEAAKVPISIRLDGYVLGALKTESERQGIPYQTYVGSILHRFVHGDLIDRKNTDIIRLLKKAA